MTKEIAFLIWLYDIQLEKIDRGDDIASLQIAEIRERFADGFGINDLILELGMDE